MLDEDLAACKKREHPHGKCEIDNTTNTVLLRCDNGYWGKDCASKCDTGGARKTLYGPGFESGPSAATCTCPPRYKFKNTDVMRGGCTTGSTEGSACSTGFHGETCEGKGAFVDCGAHGSQSAVTGACVCTGGYVGEKCQFGPAYCTKLDAAATMDPTTFKCVCSEGYTGAQCTDIADGYVSNSQTSNKPKKRSEMCLNGGKYKDETLGCECPAPFAGDKCQYQVDTCLPRSGPGCKEHSKTCTWSGGSGCDHCHENEAKGEWCCSNKWSGCGAGQRAHCVDKNSYPCTANDTPPGVIMASGGTAASAAQIAAITTNSNNTSCGDGYTGTHCITPKAASM